MFKHLICEGDFVFIFFSYFFRALRACFKFLDGIFTVARKTSQIYAFIARVDMQRSTHIWQQFKRPSSIIAPAKMCCWHYLRLLDSVHIHQHMVDSHKHLICLETQSTQHIKCVNNFLSRTFLQAIMMMVILRATALDSTSGLPSIRTSYYSFQLSLKVVFLMKILILLRESLGAMIMLILRVTALDGTSGLPFILAQHTSYSAPAASHAEADGGDLDDNTDLMLSWLLVMLTLAMQSGLR